MAIGIALVMIAGIMIRPWRSSEWAWAVGGAVAQLAVGAVSLPHAWSAISDGGDVYLFLLGIMILAEVARSQGVFTWLAGHADTFVGHSRGRLLFALYGVGVLVTATLSNDTTIILLTPAALALAKRIGGSPLPYAFACAFVANAASFLLPTGNPANLLLYGRNLPSLVPWIAIYGIAGIIAILLTYLSLLRLYRSELREPVVESDERPRSNAGIRVAFALLVASSFALCLASLEGFQLGATAFACGAIALVVLSLRDKAIPAYVARHVSWSIVPLVAGFLVVAAALENAGVTRLARTAIESASTMPNWLASVTTGITTAAFANVANNLPLAAFAARALANAQAGVAHAVVVGIDLGPNLSLSGSLATLLWLLILRREGIDVSPTHFLARGALVLAPALVASLLVLR